MAKVNLLPRKEFEIVLDDGEVIQGKYGTWAVKRFCDKRGLTLVGLTDLMNMDTLTLDMVQDFILCAVEYKTRELKKPFEFTDLDSCNWIDQLGGIDGEEYLKLAGHARSEQKKSETESQPSGMNSNVHITLPEERKTSSGEGHLKKSA